MTLDDRIWELRRQCDALQDLRREIRHVWDDTASEEVARRYLNPHRDDAKKMHQAIESLSETIVDAMKDVSSGDEFAIASDEASSRVREYLGLCQQDMNDARETLEIYAHYEQESLAKLPKITAMIDQANCCCDGVPTS